MRVPCVGARHGPYRLAVLAADSDRRRCPVRDLFRDQGMIQLAPPRT